MELESTQVAAGVALEYLLEFMSVLWDSMPWKDIHSFRITGGSVVGQLWSGVLLLPWRVQYVHAPRKLEISISRASTTAFIFHCYKS